MHDVRLSPGSQGLLCAFLAALLGTACANCAHGTAPVAAAQPVTIIYSTALVGHLEPCGCSPDQRGGVDRAAATVAAIRKEGHPVVLLDGGDRFFPATGSSDDPMVSAQQRLQADAMEKATTLMGYDALVLGARDAWAGPSFFGHFAQPLLDTGATAQPFTRTGVVVTAGGASVGVFAVGAEKDAEDIIRSRAAALRSQGAGIIVLLAYRTFEDSSALQPAAHEAGVSFILAGRADVPETHESAALPDVDPPIFTARARGEELLRLDLLAAGAAGAPFVKITGQAEKEAQLAAMQGRIDELRKNAIALSPLDPMAKLMTDKTLELEVRRANLAQAQPPRLPAGRNSFTYAFIPMSPQLPKDPAVQAVVDTYNQDVQTRNFAYAQAHPKQCPRAEPGAASFVGDQKCAECHQEAYDFWKTTPHANAYEKLAKRNRQYDVTCIGCHVTGFEKPGGACDIAQTAGRQNVQCEDCHGPGSLHSEDGDTKLIARDTSAKLCKSCHDPENSPHFNFTTYRPQILGPGHGAPVNLKKKG